MICLLLLFACGPAEVGPGVDTDAGDTGIDDPFAGVDCDLEGFDATSQYLFAGWGELAFTGRSAATAPYDMLRLALRFGSGASEEPGSHTFAGESFQSCATCLIIWAGCDPCDRTYLAESGTLDLQSVGVGGSSRMVGSLTDVVLQEVEFDEWNGTSSPIPGGETWCIRDFAIDATF